MKLDRLQEFIQKKYVNESFITKVNGKGNVLKENLETSLSEFGKRELHMAIDLLVAWKSNKVSTLAKKHFDDDTIHPVYNTVSNEVYLSNEDMDMLMMNGRELDLFITLPYSGNEGFYSDLVKSVDLTNLEFEDLEYLKTFAETLKDKKTIEAIEELM